ncbi:MAG: ROK family protein [Chitinophagaceae bacterium]|nr:ROK family protein [Chitinophagaceae bacterium]
MIILGIDVGGTGIKGGLVDTKLGKIITEKKRVLTPSPSTPETITKSISEIIEHFQWEKKAIGCGFPASVKGGIVRNASNIDKTWIGVNVAEYIKNTTQCPTYIVNDADAAGIAEIKFGNIPKELKTILFITIGTGIGSALFAKKRLVPNTELGHIIIDGKDAETYISNAVREREKLSWEEWGKRFSLYLNRLEFLFWPDAFILGGGISKEFYQFSPFIKTEVPVIPATLKNQAGIIGAALYAEKKLKK